MPNESESDTSRTEHKPTNAPRTASIAEALGVEAPVLDRFVEFHPRPTAPIILGWATSNGELVAPPEELRPRVEAWVDERLERRATREEERDPVDLELIPARSRRLFADGGEEDE